MKYYDFVIQAKDRSALKPGIKDWHPNLHSIHDGTVNLKHILPIYEPINSLRELTGIFSLNHWADFRL